MVAAAAAIPKKAAEVGVAEGAVVRVEAGAALDRRPSTWRP